ncbi:MAG: histone deacetylase [candidate division Zixibacteria bacterium]|nr:histone deacetylase [candidate division Zixibacteria bacterium]
MRTGLVCHSRYKEHDAGFGHPERAERLETLDRLFEEEPWNEKLVRVLPEPAEFRWIELAHSREYIELIEHKCSRIVGTAYIDPDTGVCSKSLEIAKLAAGGVLTAIDEVMDGGIDNCFCAVRPPGHHAGIDYSKGFCLINNIAVGAKYLREKHNIDRVAIVDWDVHHGNGTQEIFYDDPRLLYISLHQYPFYPGTGAADDTGLGAGEGYTLNIPMPAASTNDDWLEAFEKIIVPSLDDYKPGFILISAGFDGHREDPLAFMGLTEDVYFYFTDILKEIAAKYSNDRIVSVLEGGYNLTALKVSVENHLKGLIK